MFVLENHDFCKNELKYQSISYKRACEKVDLQFFKKQKFVKANSKKISISFYPTAIYKLGSQKQFSKKWKMNDYWKKKNGKSFKIGHSTLGQEDEKK